MSNINLTIALPRIRAALIATQGEFADLIGMSISMVSSVETGTRSLSDEALGNLLTALQISREELALISVKNIEDFRERNRKLAEVTQRGVLEVILAQYYARKHLKMLP